MLCFNEICVMSVQIQAEACIIADGSLWFVSQQGHDLWQQRLFFELVLDFFFFFPSLILILSADEHLPADDYPSDQHCSWTWMLSPCLNVSLVNARLHYYALTAEASCLWPWAVPVSLSSWLYSSQWVIFFPRCSPLCGENAHGPTLLIRRERSVTVEL